MAKEKQIAEIKNGAVYILEAGTPVYVKTADMCSILKKSNQWVGQLTSQGTLFKKRTPYKTAMYELAPNLRSYIESISTRAEDKDSKALEAEQKKRDADAKLKTAKASIAMVQAKELLGKMHRAEDVMEITQDLIFTIRGALLALPGRVAVDAAAAETAAEASEVIRKEVYKVMEELAGYQYNPAKYEERVRERLKMDMTEENDDGDEE